MYYNNETEKTTNGTGAALSLVPDAPMDGQAYVRKNGFWVPLEDVLMEVSITTKPVDKNLSIYTKIADSHVKYEGSSGAVCSGVAIGGGGVA